MGPQEERIIAPNAGLHGGAVAVQIVAWLIVPFAVLASLTSESWAGLLVVVGLFSVLVALEYLRVRWELGMRRLELREKLAGTRGGEG